MAPDRSGGFDTAVSERHGRPLITVTIHGHVTFASMPRMACLLELARERRATVMEISLERVTFIDSSGVGLLMALRATLMATDGQLQLTAVSDRARRIFHRTGVADLLSSSRDTPPQSAVA